MNLYLRYKIILIILLFCPFVVNVYGQEQIAMSAPPSEHHHKHISFIENKGQWEEMVKFKSEIRGGALFFESNKITYSFYDPDYLDKIQAIKTGAGSVVLDSLITCYAYRMNFLGANAKPVINGYIPFREYHNYYIGSDPAKWASKVRKYEQIRYQQLYKGIDLLFYEQYHTYKYEFVVDSGADPSLIRIQYEGADKISLKKKNLIIKIGKHETTEQAPFAYQLSETGERQQVDCHFALDGKTVRFVLGDYDATRKLIIDPTLIFASYSGSVADNWGYTATYDNEGNLYGGGTVYGTGYPVTLGVFQTSYGGGSCDIAITKFSSDGTQALFATYLGGSNADAPHSLVVNENNELYVLATTSSSNYPVTPGAYDVTFNGGTRYIVTAVNDYFYGSDIAISRFDSSGTQLLNSTLFGGSGNDGLNTALIYNYADEIRGELQLDGSGNVYVVSSTNSLDLPVTSGVFQPTYGGGTQDGFIAKFSYNLQNLIWCSYFGGNSADAIYSMELDDANNIYICGGTISSNLPTSSGAISPAPLGDRDGFVAKIAANGTSILAASYYGTDVYDQTYLLTLDKGKNIIVVGQTQKDSTYWINNASWYRGNGQFVSKLSNDLTQVIWSTSFGSATLLPNISPTALMVDICNNIHISGWGGTSGGTRLTTTGLPITGDALQRTTDGSDFYFISISADASSLLYATFFGGPSSGEHVDGGTSRFDKKGCIYQAVCAGCGRRNDFPISSPNVVGPTNNSWNCNLGVIKLDFNLQTVIADFTMPSVVCAHVEIDFINRSKGVSNATRYLWDFGDGTTDTRKDPTHIYLNAGSYNITLIVIDSSSCNIADTLTKKIIVGNNQSTVWPDIKLCKGDTVQIGMRPYSDPNTTYQWYPSRGLSGNTISNPFFIDTVSQSYTLFVFTTVCVDTFFQQINVVDMPKGANTTLIGCLGDTVRFEQDTFRMDSYIWSSNPFFSDTLNSSVSDPWLEVVLTQTTSVYYLKRTKDICEALDTLQLNASSFQLVFDTVPKMCLRDSTGLNVKIRNPHYCSFFTYDWEPSASIIGSNQVSNPLVSPHVSMYFNVLVTNEHNCTMQDSVFVDVIILEPDITTSQISCFGMHDGKISIKMSGGNPPYSYQWNHTSEDTASFENLPKGLYRVKITDSNNCTLDTSILITEPSALSITLQNVVDLVYCDDTCRGQALAVVSGGTSPYSYAWITGDNTPYIDNLCAGEYLLWVTDDHGCRDSLLFEVKDTSSMTVSYTTEPESCPGSCDGSIQVDVIQAVFPWKYIWKTGDTTAFADSLCQGIYDISITDADHCTRRIFPKVSSPPPIVVDSISIIHPYCHGMRDGSITVSIGGGTPPYTYFWDGAAGTNVLSGLDRAGNYTLKVVDNNGCEMDTTFALLNYDTLFASYQSNSVPCKEVCNGSVTIMVSGGVTPYSYVWFDGSTGPFIDNLCAGEYEVTAYDSNGCMIETYVNVFIDSIYFPQDIKAWSDTATIYRSRSTTIYGSYYGEGFDYTWSPADYLNTTKGSKAITTPPNTIIYTYTVTDSNGCIGTDTVLITVLDVICDDPYVFVPNAFSPNGDGLNDILYVRGLILEKIEFAVYDRWGEKVFETRDQNVGWNGTFREKPCSPGVYVYYLDATCIGGERYLRKGNVTLIR